MTYVVSTKKYLGNHATIVAMDGQGHEKPVLNVMRSDRDFPGNVQQLAINLASLLNDREPLHKLAIGDHDLYWSRHPAGVELRVQEEGAGLSTGCLFMTGDKDVLAKLPSVMPALCSSAEKPAAKETPRPSDRPATPAR